MSKQWHVVEYGEGEGSLAIHEDDDNRVCFMATPGGSEGAWKKIQANARLIAAAPDLLEALTRARAWIGLEMSGRYCQSTLTACSRR